MAENWKSINGSSEESSLLSQETFNTLWNMMDQSGKEEMWASFNPNNLVLSEIPSIPTVQPLQGAIVPTIISSLPAISNWPGHCEFKLLFKHPEQINKHTTWTYSPVENKLFVKKDALCPFSFQTNRLMPANVFVRAMALYSSPEHALAVVTRCINHSREELEKGIFEAEHLVRSDSRFAHYEIIPETQRHSVIVPYENPPVGQDYSTYIFSFRCYSSCAGGPNRRPLVLVFTLEQEGNVLGRITLDLKICACPGRDRLNSEKEKGTQSSSSESAVKNTRIPDPSSISVQDISKSLLEKKRKQEENATGKNQFTIKVKDHKCYLFLRQMKQLYQTHKRITGLSPRYRALLQILRSSSDEDEKS